MSILTRFHAGYFRISLSLGLQALLWKVLLQLHSKDAAFQGSGTKPKALYATIVAVLWWFSVVVQVVLSLLYALKCFLCFNTIKAEFMHHVGVNYLFAPWISWLFILESAPFVTPNHICFVVFWWVFAVPVVVLDVKIYGQWFTKGKRFLTAVANPTSQLSVVGNLVGARAAAKMRWQEVALFLFSLGMVHYLVLFVTLYQRVAGGHVLPAMLRPVFFLFFAAPGVASLAWFSISGSFDTASKMLFFLSLFMFASLICRPFMFKKAMERYNVAWWAYSYPITMLALASTRYEEQVKGGVPRAIRLALSILSVLVLITLLIFTAANPKLLLPDHHHDHDNLRRLPITHCPKPTPTPTPTATATALQKDTNVEGT
ncbi:S-type anion channel SLAH4-like [Andrographis paniculata]|uniref:S-type anion channel SLAH4-like n=1 Tax=Andrographis paniculata TaxID=175694 RepID=UPI0021E8CE5C|nr:S-type anion channel SLAH4-like [Andrographis paniculata]